MNRANRKRVFTRVLGVLAFLLTLLANPALANTQNKPGIIKGKVTDELGKPIVGAVISIFRASTSKLLKQTYTDSDGNFSTKVLPGIYKISATADGYSSKTIESVQIGRSGEFSYGFKLERVGFGKTLPEKSPERNTPKYVIRASKLGRSIYQSSEGEKDFWSKQQDEFSGKDESLKETDRVNTKLEYYNSDKPSVAFAHFQKFSEKTDLFIIGQIDSISFPQQKFQTHLKYRLNRNHNLNFSSSFVRFNGLNFPSYDSFNKVSLELFDKWEAREGVLVVLGLNYSKSTARKGVFTPKIGVKVDLNSATRIKSSLSPVVSDSSPWEYNFLSKDAILIFSSSASQLSSLAGEISNRFEASVERDLDRHSNLEFALFFDKTQIPENRDQEESGFRVTYSRRLNDNLSALAGYSFAKNQNHQSFFGQVNANLKDGTRVQAFLRLSSNATILSVDPFQNKLTVYDPGLSIFITHPLPNLGLPIRAEAILDARNIIDLRFDEQKASPKLSSSGRVFRGGISVKF